MEHFASHTSQFFHFIGEFENVARFYYNPEGCIEMCGSLSQIQSLKTFLKNIPVTGLNSKQVNVRTKGSFTDICRMVVDAGFTAPLLHYNPPSILQVSEISQVPSSISDPSDLCSSQA